MHKKCFMFFIILALIITAAGRLAAYEEYTLDCIADAPMYGYPSEANSNWGGRPYMRIKDFQGIPFMQFDFEGLQGMRVISCTLFVSSVPDMFAFTTDIISTIMVPWYEGTKDGESEVGASCYNYRVYPDSLWAGVGSDARNVINGEMG
ncbi:MAG: hypothetical protein U9N45_00475, partial [Gemmatimonadota bacterium]|nr:hypothetical protein [Gemmatimonadota bacterium]